MKHIQIICIVLISFTQACLGASAPSMTEHHSIQIKQNYVVLDGKHARLAYRDSGDLDRDGRVEDVLTVMLGCAAFYTVVARQNRNEWKVITAERSGYEVSRADVADVNRDGRLEVIERSMSGDGHYICSIYNLKAGRLVSVPSENDFFGQTRFVDIDHDGKLELLSISDPSFGYLGDFWLTIYKWNCKKYVDVSYRYPKQYNKVIRDIKRKLYKLQYTSDFGHPESPEGNPAFADLHYYIGKAYELQDKAEKAKAEYAIAYRLYPDSDWIRDTFRRTWKTKPK